MPLGNPIRKQNESRIVSVLATEGQSVFTVQGGYIINQISVFRNGVRLSNSEDFTAGDGSTVTLNNQANIDDRIEFHIFDRFTVQNAIVGAASSQTISGDVVVNGKIFGNLDVPNVNTGIVTATELDLNGKGDISSDLTIGRHLNVTGISTFKNNVHLLDSDRLQIGGSAGTVDGIELYHNGSHSYIDNSTGSFFVRGDTIKLRGKSVDEDFIEAFVNGSVRIYYNNSIHLETTPSGVDVTGTLNVTGISTLGNDVSIADKIIHTGDTNTAIRFPSADTITAETSGTEAIRINNSGQFLVGVTAARTMLSGYTPSLQVEGTANSDSSVSIVENISATSGPSLWFGKTRGNSLGANTVVQSGDELGTIVFNGADGSDVQSMAAFIRASVDGTPGSNDMPGRITIHTTADGAASPTERLRITSAGELLLGATASAIVGGGGASLYQIETTTQNAISCVSNRGTGNASGSILILGKSRGTSAGSVTAVASGDELGALRFAGADGTDLQSRGAEISGEVDGTPGSNDMPGRLLFKTTADGASTSTERMRIDNAGRVSIGDNNAQTVYPFYVAKDLNSGGNLLSFGNTDSTYSQSLTLSFDSNKDMKWAGGSGSGGLIWDVGTRGFSFKIGSSEKLKVTSSGQVFVGDGVTSSYDMVLLRNTDGNTVAQIVNTNTGSSVQSILQLQVGSDRYVNFAANYVNQYLQIGGVNLVTSYNDFDTHIFRNNSGTEAFRITSAQNVNIAGQGSVFGRLNVPVTTQSGGSAIQVMNTAGGSGDGTTTNIVLRSTNSTGTQWAHSEYRSQSHKFQVQTTNKVTINANGLCFDSNTAAANALDAYEEGSFTPRLRAHDSTTGSVTGSGSYQRIGNRVWLHISFNGVVTTSIPSGKIIRIDQLPYAAVGVTAAYEVTSTWMAYGITMRESTTFYTENGAAYITGIYATSAGQWFNTTTNDFNQGTIYLNFNMNYRIAAQ